MDDTSIVQLYWDRSEQAIAETEIKYGAYCYCIAYNILSSNEDAEESVNDTYMTAWNKLPPHRPAKLAAFLGKIARCISINRWKARTACKRGDGEMPLVLEELADCVDQSQDVASTYESIELMRTFNRFLDTLPEVQRNIFLRRYWLFDPIGDIAKSYGFSTSKVASMLHRLRIKLREQLEKEDYL